MEINPYQPPADFAASLADDPAPSSGPRTRPIGIWILCGLHLLAGLLCLLAIVGLVFQLRSLDRGEGAFYSFLWFVATMCGLLAAMALSSSVGLWLGARWGWWIAAFYYVWAVLGVMADFLLTMSVLSQMDAETIVVALAGKVIQLVIHALILAYLFKRNVLAYFRLQSLRVDRALIPLVIIAVVLLAATYYVTSTRLANPF